MTTGSVASARLIPLDPSEILTKREVAERLKVSVRTVENLHLPVLKLGSRSNRYIWSAVLKNLQEQSNGR